MSDPQERLERALAPTPSPEAVSPFQQRADAARQRLEANQPAPSPEATTPFQQRADEARMRAERAFAPTPGTIESSDMVSPGRQAAAPTPEPAPEPEPVDPNDKGGTGKPEEITGSDVARFEGGTMETFEQRAGASVEQADEIASVLEGIEERIETSDLKSVERQFAVAEAQRVRLEQIDQNIQQLENEQFDASRLFAGADGATRFGAILGVAVGHSLQVRNNILFPGSNTPNAALQIINDAIDRDIRTQVQQHQQGLNTIAQRRTAMGLAREVGLSEVAAENFARERMLESVQRQLTSLAHRHRGTQQALVLNQLANQFGLQRAEVARAREIEMQAMMMQQAGAAGRQADLTVWNPLSRFVQVTNPEQFNAVLERVKQLGGSGVISRLQEQSSGTISFVDGIDRVVRQVESMGGIDAVVGTRAAAVTSQINQLMLAYKQAMGAGALDQGLQEVFKEIIADPTNPTAFVGNFLAQAQELRLGADRTMRGIAASIVDAGGSRFTGREVGAGRAETQVTRDDQADIEQEAGGVASMISTANEDAAIQSATLGGDVTAVRNGIDIIRSMISDQ